MQEALTYLIIGSAVTIVILKLIKQFAPKKKKKVDYNNLQLSNKNHNCSECSAECLLRDIPKQVKEINTDVCHKVEEKSKLS